MPNKLIFVLLFSVISNRAFAQSTDFSGRWIINYQKSDFGSAPSFVMPEERIIKQTVDSIYVSGVSVDQAKKKSNSSGQYSLDGKSMERLLEQNLRVAGSFRFSDDKTKLLKDQKWINDSMHLIRTVKEIWTLSDDGKILTVEQTNSLSNGNCYSIKAVYDKN